MSTSKHIDRICAAAVAIALVIMLIFANGEALGIQASARVMGYENRLFDRSQVHMIDIVMDDWDSFINTVENEEYAMCSLVIDGEGYKNVAIRGKGNTSMSGVSQMNSDRYSFKVEFDHYDSTRTYYGLDKLCLNNIIQDNTFMKDYLTYTLMGDFDVAAPLCSYAYITVNFDSYSNIFDRAKTDITDEDKQRLIASLKTLNESDDVSSAVDIEQVIRYFVVHNFVCNGDSYTGSMVHNYYLYEEEGRLSMIPWDYNLAFGTFRSGNASEQVNYPIDSPVSGEMSDRPMVAWIFDSEEYTALYHELFAQFLSHTDFASIISDTAELIAPYVEKDPTGFCTYEKFEAGVSAITQFCTLREESVSGQLDGSIPSTSEGQSADSSSLVETGSLVLSDMGTMNMGGDDFGGDHKEFDRNPSEQMSNNAPQPEQAMPQDLGDNKLLLLIISAAVLAVGLLTAFLYKR